MNVVIFREEDFPCIDSAPLSVDALRAAFSDQDNLVFANIHTLPSELEKLPDLFMLSYGSAFPADGWPAILSYLQRGGNWVRGAFQAVYGRKLLINHTHPVELPAGIQLRCPPLDVDLESQFSRFKPLRVWELQPRFTTVKDFPGEAGSSGSREATIKALAVAEAHGRAIAAPIVAIDRTAGPCAGGRWVLLNCLTAAPFPSRLISRVCEYATRPRARLTVTPSFACYYPGEMACLSVSSLASVPGELKINLRVYSRDSQKEIYAHTYRASSGVSPAIIQTSPFPAPDPGLYIVRANVEAGGRSKPIAFAETGFWVYDRDLIASGKPLETCGDLFTRGGVPLPVTGTTYMSGDAHRKFLFEPNPALWDTDMAAMSAAGVNLLRTGLWTAWQKVMLDSGAVDEGVLRALMAYILCARRHDLPVIFNIFAFLPETWGGENAYLDPRAIAAQSAFIAAFTRRFTRVADIAWDFINEPSFCSAHAMWKCRPNGDRFERAAWAKWLANQGVSEQEWRDRWRLTPDEPLDLPHPDDFEGQSIVNGTHPFRAIDYRRFAQDVFAQWVRQMAVVVHENGNPTQKVTVGQDEGGNLDRPNPLFHSEAVDFTTNHSWWENGDLLLDSLMGKTSGKPHLIEETGIMLARTQGGLPWRTEAECRNLLEQKMALSFAGGCAGFIQWLWNTNVYMASDCEAAIGLLRADGTEKPEMEAFREAARFFAAGARWMTGRKPEDTVVVISHAALFSPENRAYDSIRRAVRTLEYSFGVGCRCVAERNLKDAAGAKTILLPAPGLMSDSCLKGLLQLAKKGARVLITGAVDKDEYERELKLAVENGFPGEGRPVMREEYLEIENEAIRVPFGSDTLLSLRCGPGHEIIRLPIGSGEMIFCPIPVELAEGPLPTEALYSHVFSLVTKKEPGFLERRVRFAEADLLICVNETPLQLPASTGNIVPAGRTYMAFLRPQTGEVIR